MRPHLYVISTLIGHGIQLLGAFYIKDVGLIFEFLTAINVSTVSYFIPGVFFFMVRSKFASEE